MDLEQDLNPQQREAVRHEGGPLLVLAGAGSGKTRVLTYRIAHLVLHRGMSPSQILAITFTNKAAEEMRVRLKQLLGPDSESMWAGTFHATCARILRQHVHRLGFQRNFVIYDDTDQLRVIKACIKAQPVQDKRIRPVVIRSMLDKAKNHAIDPAGLIPVNSPFQEVFRNVFSEYKRILKEANALDFGDLLLFVLELLETHPEILMALRDRFRSVLVDEYQDTNRTQHELLKKLVSPGGDLCVVGDDDQSIYRWRGAEIRNMLDFEAGFPGARVLTLEQNYRSTQTILDAATAVARGNPDRREKRLWTANGPGEPIGSFEATTQDEEAEIVSREILSLVSSSGASFGDIGIFFRTNAQSRPLEEMFVPYRIPYAVVGSLRFYERAEIKDLLAYLRFLYNPRDSVSLLRIVNRPPRGIGPVTQNRLEAFAAQSGQSVWEAMGNALTTGVFSGASHRKIQGFHDQIQKLHAELDRDINLSSLLSSLLNQTGYREHLASEPDGDRRQENVEELLRTAAGFEQTHHEEKGRNLLGVFCERIALITNVDQAETRSSCVSLMTLHCAKGLEFPVVFLLGMEEGLLPHERASLTNEDLAEERRLCYVGMTRARKKLYISRAKTRTTYGERQVTRPSRFLNDIPAELIALPAGTVAQYEDAPLTGGETDTKALGEESSSRIPPPALSPPPSQKQTFTYRIGDRVEHETLGQGIVRKVERDGDKEKIIVEFLQGKKRKLMAHVAPIRKISSDPANT